MPYDMYTIETNGTIRYQRLDKAPTLNQLQKEVQGSIETVSYFTKFHYNQLSYSRGRCYCNENGMSEGKQINYKASMLWKNQFEYASWLLGNVVYYAKAKVCFQFNGIFRAARICH